MSTGITTRSTLDNCSVETWNNVLNCNLRGPFVITQAAVKLMRRRGRGGAIVNISSVHAHGGGPEHFAYGTSKSALNFITRHNAAELMHDGIRVNAVNVGWCVTPSEDLLQRSQAGEDWVAKAEAKYPTGKLLRPADVAAVVLFLLSKCSARVSGTCIDMHPELVPGCLPRVYGSSED